MSLHQPTARKIDARKLRFGIVAARFNEALVDALVERAGAVLAHAGARNVRILLVPGSHEVPVAAQWLAASGRHDCVVALGVLIGGDTNHHEMVGSSVSQALQQVALSTGVPVINGVIVTENMAQAKARCTGKLDRGAEFGRAALEMAALARAAKGRR